MCEVVITLLPPTQIAAMPDKYWNSTLSAPCQSFNFRYILTAGLKIRSCLISFDFQQKVVKMQLFFWELNRCGGHPVATVRSQSRFAFTLNTPFISFVCKKIIYMRCYCAYGILKSWNIIICNNHISTLWFKLE